MSCTPRTVVRAEDLEPSTPDLMAEIQATLSNAHNRHVTLEMAECLTPGRVHVGADGSVWAVAVDPGVELRGWLLWP